MNARTMAAVALLSLLAAACSSNASGGEGAAKTASGGSATDRLIGTFRIDRGVCNGGRVSGSYFRMVQSGGNLDAGPFVTNGDSSCADKTYTALRPGTDGGLRTGAYQAQPDPPFDGAHNGAAARITRPAKFFAVEFALSTNARDPQTGAAAPPPSLAAGGRELSGNLSALGVGWNGQQFNQGAPKPDGKTGSLTTGPTGTFDARTGRYSLGWTSQIAGGPFNGFTGIWHLEGTFQERS